jgi:aryl carrier-like protein
MTEFEYIIAILLFSVAVSCQNNRQQNKDDFASDYNQLVENKIDELTIENLNKQIENQKVYFGSDSLKMIDMKHLIKKHKFFLYFSSITCSPCIEQTVKCIEDVFPKYNEDDEIIFIAPDYPGRIKNNYYGKKLLSLKNNTLGISLENKNIPFIFTLSEEMRIKELHIVNKNDFHKTVEFLNKLNSKY